MVKGSATLMQATKTAPSGSTIRGVAALENNVFLSAVIDAIDAANN